MPSWTSRLRHAPQASNVPQARIPDHSHLAKYTNNEQMPGPGPLSPSKGPGPRHTSSQSSRHGRSLSHPLTLLLGHGRKGDDRYRNGSNATHARAQDDSVHYSQPDTNIDDQSDVPNNASTPKAQNLELIAGRCATCDSTIKWPKHLKVFRCTICLMVNDLRPLERRPQDDLYPQKNEGRTSIS